MEKCKNEIFIQSPGSRYLALPGKLLHRAANGVHGMIRSVLKSKKKRGLHRQKARIHVRIISVEPTFRVISEALFGVSSGHIPAGPTSSACATPCGTG